MGNNMDKHMDSNMNKFDATLRDLNFYVQVFDAIFSLDILTPNVFH